jgi:hypothetical protein
MTKIRADRINPVERGNGHLLQLGSIKAFPAFDDPRLHSFAIDREGYENDFPVVTANAGATERDIMNVEQDRRTRCRGRWFSHVGKLVARSRNTRYFGDGVRRRK